eukprot:3878415-Pleurochrysis_carterae.AAC.1
MPMSADIKAQQRAKCARLAYVELVHINKACPTLCMICVQAELPAVEALSITSSSPRSLLVERTLPQPTMRQAATCLQILLSKLLRVAAAAARAAWYAQGR